MHNQHHRGPTSLKRFAIRRAQKPDRNSTGDNEALTMPSPVNPLFPIVEANLNQNTRLPTNEEQPIETEFVEGHGRGPDTC